jgi:hypothetical protein
MLELAWLLLAPTVKDLRGKIVVRASGIGLARGLDLGA